jgi:hypothetical protein
MSTAQVSREILDLFKTLSFELVIAFLLWLGTHDIRDLVRRLNSILTRVTVHETLELFERHQIV